MAGKTNEGFKGKDESYDGISGYVSQEVPTLLLSFI